MHRIDGPGATIDNEFTEGNPTEAVPATVVTDDWLNDVQEELMSLLAAASIAPVKGTQDQVLAALRATGLFQTAAQFDSTTKAATTEFVQRALGNDRGYVGITSNTSLTAAHCGMAIFASTSSGAITLSLPAANALAAGAKFKIFNTGADDVIVTRVGGDTIVLGTTSNTVTAVTLKSGDWIELVSLGTGTLWYHTGGTAQLGYAGAFGASLLANGYQKLPGGFILQWGNVTASTSGTAVVFPITFPSACLIVQVTDVFAGPLTAASVDGMTSYNAKTTSGFTALANGSADWLAIGR